uniref:Uncharacterized protein n=1 Tax=Rhizophora mucronata TaxID=61149 RepID=A0A2P2IP75_RHIMU
MRKQPIVCSSIMIRWARLRDQFSPLWQYRYCEQLKKRQNVLEHYSFAQHLGCLEEEEPYSFQECGELLK